MLKGTYSPDLSSQNKHNSIFPRVKNDLNYFFCTYLKFAIAALYQLGNTIYWMNSIQLSLIVG